MDTVTLFRPSGEKELALIRASGWREFPQLLPEQPIFCPLLSVAPATWMARDLGVRDGGSGYVVQFEVQGEYLKQFPIQMAGSRLHHEYWIPADQLDEFNRHIVGLIEIVSEFKAESKLPVQ